MVWLLTRFTGTDAARLDTRWDKILAEAGVLLYMVVSERESYYDDRSEEWQESERGEEFIERTDALKEIEGSLGELV